jgi:hypothetical protein
MYVGVLGEEWLGAAHDSARTDSSGALWAAWLNLGNQIFAMARKKLTIATNTGVAFRSVGYSGEPLNVNVDGEIREIAMSFITAQSPNRN